MYYHHTRSVVAEKVGGSIKVKVSSGIKTLMVLKTTQSGFENFHRDEFRALPDTNDRYVRLLLLPCKLLYAPYGYSTLGPGTHKPDSTPRKQHTTQTGWWARRWTGSGPSRSRPSTRARTTRRSTRRSSTRSSTSSRAPPTRASTGASFAFCLACVWMGSSGLLVARAEH